MIWVLIFCIDMNLISYIDRQNTIDDNSNKGKLRCYILSTTIILKFISEE